MAIQGAQVPIYTNTHYFCIFMIFLFLFKKKKTKKKPKLNNQTKTDRQHQSMNERCRGMKA